MATDNLKIFGDEFNNVTGVKATDIEGNVKTYIRPQGTLSITQNGTNIDVTQYASVNVDVAGGHSGVIISDTIDEAGGTVREITTTNNKVKLQQKEVIPTEYTQTIYPDEGYDGMSTVKVGSISGDLISDVMFFDYDGTVLYRYSAEEFLELNSMPEGPVYTDTEVSLTFQGWNYQFLNAKSYVQKYGRLNVGATVIPTDNKTHVILRVDDENVNKTIGITVSNCLIDWGDGDTTTADGSYLGREHTYTTKGTYDITLESTSSTKIRLGFGGIVNNYAWNNNKIDSIYVGYNVSQFAGMQYTNSLKIVTLPRGVITLDQNTFLGCYSLQAINLPDSTVNPNSQNIFYNCRDLKSITFPDTCRSLGNYILKYCRSLQSLTIPEGIISGTTEMCIGCYSLISVVIPDTITSLAQSSFQYCYSLKDIYLSSKIVSIGTSAFQDCRSLENITMPSDLTSIAGSMFYGCISLRSLVISNKTTSIDQYFCRGCLSLKTVTLPTSLTSTPNNFGYNFSDTAIESITLPNGMTRLGQYCFYNCVYLKNITLPNTLTVIDTSSLQSTHLLSSLTIPASVTTINNNWIAGAYNLTELIMLPTTPPTMNNAGIQNNADLIIYVPYSSDHSILNAYKTATNWSTYASKMQELPES